MCGMKCRKYVSRYKQVAECAKTYVNKTAVVLKNSG